ncbi:hypothetical protein HUJ04_006320 [Dendroctonus ponderosae]|nr:hypothetical protein HUJ04_006320 [Dendroctonus ponderosae]KAH1005314.1 hypothetical protein HUJ04_006320 [Dendroctonus ponderosae]
MAKNNNLVLLGYEDELITDKYRNQVNFTTNKIGGDPDFPHSINNIETHITCKLCKFPCRLVVQIYAPLGSVSDHRTLYVFACINPTCWNKSESWTCLRVQHINLESSGTKPQAEACKLKSTDWCFEADDWGNDDANSNFDEQNCNVFSNSEKVSEDEESSSFEDSVMSGLGSLSIDERNANNGAQGGAVARLHAPMATAEIEADEDGVVTAETPTRPKYNLEALLSLDRRPDIGQLLHEASFQPYFISVYAEEELKNIVLLLQAACSSPVGANHVKELLSDYQRLDADFALLQEGQKGNHKAGEANGGDMGVEEYEEAVPLHGDKMFHYFITRVKSNPEQILRYHREGVPLLLYPLQEPIGRCKNCQQEQVFELQLVPTLVSKLRLSGESKSCPSSLDFGTVLVYTCRNSCWGPNDLVKEETVLVQKEMF